MLFWSPLRFKQCGAVISTQCTIRYVMVFHDAMVYLLLRTLISIVLLVHICTQSAGSCLMQLPTQHKLQREFFSHQFMEYIKGQGMPTGHPVKHESTKMGAIIQAIPVLQCLSPLSCFRNTGKEASGECSPDYRCPYYRNRNTWAPMGFMHFHLVHCQTASFHINEAKYIEQVWSPEKLSTI